MLIRSLASKIRSLVDKTNAYGNESGGHFSPAIDRWQWHLGRPVSINTDDSDVEMISEEDFIEDEGDPATDYRPDPVHVQFFLQYVKLCEIMGLVLSQQYSVASKARRTNAIDLTHSDMALADWLQNCPERSVLGAIAAPLLVGAAALQLLVSTFPGTRVA